ncbi:MAG: asparagine synthase (glutamine-hydrolyzing) [Sphingobacteriales bacterium 17-39-43]|uniref:asparagine synthase (glutamine-hydrolyzing) n=1 Tax=Daejeonella sp. TaxID=2805397 RepID=UPI000BCBDF81|nr:asparagine synthase (glutamine-hydrolyzing) [Daejeonella sp.]OYZ30183.1 MAG: asparagine synthase (glutamine-hydrolyzing) [Sphingobacteriales bacterium 16-39-50]OZA22926.1 MAG: asparagine synthase (glutamine-hydrolyzing) [Sphingobacteriales bacterium 17-39-43]HQT24181.1 asparagine synthase (glutamine-hydrolyzing) [Daejeonella sp.]HQT58791.1 asparagine synthase (glutamine-hydrolyzing) [Daejeonella sp.]
MCGIAGIFNLKGVPISRQEIKSMTDAIAHRGPDGEGIFLDGNLALGHRRLAILDTSPRGAQPMMSKDSKWVIIFNGCIYNFQQLRLELQSKGHEFVSTSDTEVIVEGLSAYGPSFFERLDGMFAVAAWDKTKKELWLSRDRYGVKPLYYYMHGGVLLFASEIKAFMANRNFSVEVNHDSLNEYFTFQNMFSYQTLFKNVYMLPQANTVRINTESSEVKHYSWWDYDFSQADETMTFEDARDETQRLFSQAVTKQMVSDVPVGSYLSGGMDSGSIAVAASRHVPRLFTFTCGFDMSEVTGVEANYDERRDAELTANYIKSEHYEQVMNAGDLRWSLPKLVWHLEDLRVGMSYPNYYISRLASKFVKVCLQGTGGDELYGGYPWRYYRIFRSLGKQDFFDQYYDFWQRMVKDSDKKQLFTADTYEKISNIAEPRNIFERVFLFNDKLGYDTPEQHINNSLYFEIKTFLPGLLLVGDKLAMAHGLEERFPFMDNDLVNFAQKIPVRHKLGNLELMKKIDENEFRDKKKMYTEHDDGKNVLRKAMMGFLPEKIINRKKQGFSAPDESWYRGENAAYMKELLLNKRAVSSEFINPKYVEKIVDEHINKKINHRLLLWSMMNFEWWCKVFLSGEKVQ